MHDYDKLLRAALMTAHRYARGGYAGQGFVDEMPTYDPMGNVIVGGGSEDTSSPLYKAIEAASIGLGKAGAAVGEPLRKGAENYLGNVGKAFHESGEYARQGLENTVSDKGPLYNTSGPLQYALGSMGQAFSPLTGAAMSAGQAATQLTGNPDFGNRVEFVGGLMDPSHIGMLKGAAAIPMAARTAAKAEEAAQAVALAKQQRELSPLGFYSHGAETAAGLQQAKGTPQQYYSMLEKGGVKPAELEGFNEAFANRPSVTREEIAAHFRERMPQVEETVLGRDQLSLKERHRYYDLDDAVAKDGINALSPEQQQEYYALQNKWNQEKPTKFGQYTFPGGENYREVLLKLPNKQERDFAFEWFDPATQTSSRNTFASQAEAQAAAPEGAIVSQRQIAERNPVFKSSHWDDPNVLAHLRMSDRTGPNGEKILHVEEIQSDWGQKGKKEGFGFAPGEKYALDDKIEKLAEQRQALRRSGDNAGADAIQDKINQLVQQGNKKIDGIIPGPYVTNTQAWTDLALKRALREAAEGGYDKLVWTPGAEQAKRYDLSRHIDNITWSPEPDGKYWVGATKDGRPVRGLENEPMDAKKLEATFGKEIAEKIVNGEGKKIPGGPELELSGLDLQTGGEGMKGYYDKIVPTQLSKLVKKLDPEAKIGRDSIQTQDTPRTMAYFLDWARAQGSEIPRPTLGQMWQNGANEPLVQQFMKETSGLEVPSLTITPKMREAILSGQTAFKRGGTIPFGPEAAQRAVQIAKQQAGRR